MNKELQKKINNIVEKSKRINWSRVKGENEQVKKIERILNNAH